MPPLAWLRDTVVTDVRRVLRRTCSGSGSGSIGSAASSSAAVRLLKREPRARLSLIPRFWANVPCFLVSTEHWRRDATSAGYLPS